MVRRINALSSSRLACSVLCLLTCTVFAHSQSAESTQQRSASGSMFLVAPTIGLDGTPTSVATGDLRGDGRVDLVLTKAGSGSVTVLLGDGKGGFAAGAEYAAGTRPGSVLLADLSGTGRLDIAALDSASGAVKVLRSNGDGTFSKAVSFAGMANPVGLALGNFGGKGKIDLAVAAKTGITVLLNDGTGHFTTAGTVSVSHELSAISAADLKGEGHDDLIAANGDGTVTVLEGDGSGHFRATDPVKVAEGALGVVVAGDFNRDGRADIAVAPAGSNKVTVLLGRGDGSFEAGADYRVGNNPVSILVADLKGNGGADLITANSAANTFSVLMGRGDGSFKAAVDFGAGNSPIAVAAGDFDHDGHADLAILNAGDKSISVPLGHGDGTFRAALSYPTGLEQKSIAAGDLTGHGLTDLVVTNYCGGDEACKGRGTATVMLAETNGGYKLGSTYELGLGPVAAALANVKGTKNLDLVAVNRGDKTLMVMAGKGNGKFGAVETYALSASPRAVFAGDFNGDGRPDLAIATDCGRSACPEAGSVEVWLGQANGKLAFSASYAVGFSPASIAAGDLRGTGHLDLLVANSCGNDSSCKSHGTATLLKGDGKGKFADGGDIELGKAPSSIAIGRLTGKGLDLVVAERGSNQISVLHGDGKGGFGEATAYKAGQEPAALAIADFDHDGRLDVAVANFKDSTVSVLRGSANGALKAAVNYPVGAGPESMVSVGGKSGSGGLVTANGNGGSKPMGTDVTLLLPPPLPPSMTVLTPSPATPTVVDQSVSLTAAVTGASPTGTVAFTSTDITGGTTLATLTCTNVGGNTLTSGSATCDLSNMPAKTYYFVATYSGDGANAGGHSTIPPAPFVIGTADTITTLGTSNATPNVNQTVSFTATVAVAPAPSGTAVLFGGKMQFQDNGVTITGCGAVAVNTTTGVANCNNVALVGGSHSIVANYSADSNYNDSTGAVTETVSPVSTGTTVGSSANPSVVNQSVKFTANVTPFGSAIGLTGSVTFTDNGNPADCTVAFVPATGVATCTIAALSQGSHTIKAVYGSDPSYTTSNGSVTQTVNVATTTTGLATSGSPSTINAPVTFTATVTEGTAGSIALSGSVEFSSGGTDIPNCSTVAVNGSGVATCATSGLALGPNSIKAAYANDSNFSGSNKTITQTVTIATATSLLLGQSAGSTTVNQSVTFTATLTFPQGPTALSGTTSFNDSATGVAIPGCATVSPSAAGVSTCTTTGLTLGAHNITAVYSSDPNFHAATSNVLSHPVTSASSTITLTSSSAANTSTVNQTVVFTASIPPPSGTPLSGTVKFTDTPQGGAATTIAGCGAIAPTVAGKAVCSDNALTATVSTHTITAIYSGDVNFTISNGTLNQTVNPATTSLALSTSGSPSSVNQQVTFTAIVTAPAGGVTQTGTVTFSDSVTAAAIPSCSGLSLAPSGSNPLVASCPTSTLILGPHTITAKYSGDNNFGTSSNTVAQSVTAASSNITLTTSSSPSLVNQTVTFTANIPVSSGSAVLVGTVAFTVDGTTVACPAVVPQAPTPPSTNWTAVCQDGLLTNGSHTINATYGHDTNFNVGSGMVTQTVTPGSTTVAVSAAPSPSFVNNQVTITATVTPNPSGGVKLSGTVEYFDNGQAISTCTAVSVSPTTGVANCALTTLKVGTHHLVATYGNDTNFTGNSNSFDQTVNPSQGQINVSSTASPSTVNGPVTFTASFTTPSTITSLAGKVFFYNNGTANPIPACQAVVPELGTVANSWQATCTFSALTAGNHTIQAIYTGDPNFTVTAGTFGQQVNQATATPAIAGVPSSAVVVNPKNEDDSVTLTATLTVAAGPVALSTGGAGTMEFFSNGTAIAGCTKVAVTVTDVTTATNQTATASCPVQYSAVASSSSLANALNGLNTIAAQYGGDPNFTAPVASGTELVQDFSLAISVASPVTLSQGFTSSTDQFTPQSISVSPAPIQGFTTAAGAPLNVNCTIANLPGSAGKAPKCSLYLVGTTTASSTLAVSSGATQPSLGILVDATSASAGLYQATLTATDPTTGLVHSSVPFAVNVNAVTSPISFVSGTTSDNTGTVTFVLPAGVVLTGVNCMDVAGTGITSTTESPGAIGIKCDVNPSTVGSASSTSVQVVKASVVVTTGNTPTAGLAKSTNLLVAGVFGLPLFGLLGLLGRKKDRKAFYRLLGLMLISAAALVPMGCGGTIHTTKQSQGGTTPPGSYYLLIQGTHNTSYSAVLQVHVEL